MQIVRGCLPLRSLPSSLRSLLLLSSVVGFLAAAAQAQVTFGGVQTTAVSGLNLPLGVAVDTVGDVFVADTNNARIVEQPVSGLPLVVLANSLPNNPNEVALDSAGNIYYSLGRDNGVGNGIVYEVPAAGGTPTATPMVLYYYNGNGVSNPAGLALDQAGDVYMADSYGGYVAYLPRSGAGWGTEQVLLNAPAAGTANTEIAPWGIGLDSGGDLYTADGYGDVLEMDGSGANYRTPYVRAAGTGAVGLASDGAGDLYISDPVNQQVLEIPAAGGPTIALPFSFDGVASPQGVAVDAKGDVYVADAGDNEVIELETSSVNMGQISVSPESLQQSLSFNLATGTTVRSIAVLTEGAVSGDFSVASGTTCAPGTALQLTTCTVNVAFAPTAPGIRQGAVVFYDQNNQQLLSLPIYGFGVAPQIAFEGETPVSAAGVGANLSEDNAVAVDGAGNLFVVIGTGQGSVVEFPRSGSGYGAATTVASNLAGPVGLAVDGAGNLFVSLYSANGQILEIPRLPSGYGAPVTIASNLSNPYGLTVDQAGNIFFTCILNGQVMEILRSSSGYSQAFPVASNISSPYSVAVDARENLYVTSLYDSSFTPGTGSVVQVRYTPVGYSAPNQLAGNLNYPWGIWLDHSGSVIYSVASDTNQDDNTGALYELPNLGLVSDFGNPVPLTGSLSYPGGIGEDSAGNIYYTNADTGVIMSLPRGTAPALSFSATQVGQLSSQTQIVTLRNIGNVPLTLSAINFPASFPESTSGASTDCFASQALEPGSACPLTISFEPASSGVLSGALSVTDNNLNVQSAVQAIALTGTGVSPVAVTLSATSLSFGNETVGAASNSQSVTMTNNGSSALSITSIAVTGTNASSFVFANSCGTSLAAGASCSIHGHFAPTKAGSLPAAVTITDNAGNSPQTIALSGTGVNPPVTLSATALTFASTIEGESSSSQSVTMTNTGTAALTISSMAVTGTNASSFVFASTCGTSLAVGANCTIHGHFGPVATGALKASITITDSAAGSPQTIALAGTGLKGPVTLSAYSLSFGSVKVGSTSASQTVVVTNTGTAALSITSISVTGANASSFVFANSCGTTLAVNATCTIHGHFAPTETGTIAAAITITDSATTSPQTIALAGTGLSASPVTLSATSLSFPATTVGSISASQTVVITNTGSATLTITSIAVTGADASSFVFANNCGTTLAVSANCSIHGHFAPTATGAMTAAIYITDSAAGSPQTITLSGAGQ